jgi:hypothetical protein
MLIGVDGKAAGDFSVYASKCDLFKAGWKLFRPEAYDFSLVLEGATPSDDTVVDAESVVCPEEMIIPAGSTLEDEMAKAGD